MEYRAGTITVTKEEVKRLAQTLLTQHEGMSEEAWSRLYPFLARAGLFDMISDVVLDHTGRRHLTKA